MTTTTCTAKKPGIRGYKAEGCRCRTCTDASNAYDNRRRRHRGYGIWQALVDAQPVEQHITALLAAGLGVDRIAELASVHHKTITAVMRSTPDRPKAARVRPGTAQAILAIPVNPFLAADGSDVNGLGTRRRLQALRAAGWTAEALGELLGCRGTNVAAMCAQPKVKARTARQVASLYERISHVRPEGWAADRSRRQTLARGWAPPAAWDDDRIDDPRGRPSGILPAGGGR